MQVAERLYDPDLVRVQSWGVLECVVHEGCNGLKATPDDAWCHHTCSS